MDVIVATGALLSANGWAVVLTTLTVWLVGLMRGSGVLMFIGCLLGYACFVVLGLS